MAVAAMTASPLATLIWSRRLARSRAAKTNACGPLNRYLQRRQTPAPRCENEEL